MEIVFDKTKKVLLSLVLTLLFISITTSVFAANTFKLNIASATIYEGKEFELTADEQRVTWTSSDPSKATVNSSGKVTAIKKGTVTITAEKNGEKHSCEIKIKKQSFIDKLRGITMNASAVTLHEGEKIVLKTGQVGEWKTTNKYAATVVAGRTAGNKPGIAIISQKVGNKTATCWVTVKKYKEEVQTTTSQTVKVEGVTLNRSLATLEKGSNLTLTATVSPNDAANKQVDWTSTNTNVATVSNGVVTAKNAGTTIITAKAKDGSDKTGSCVITVTNSVIKVDRITLNQTSATIEKGKELTLIATVTPNDATNKQLEWTSNNTSVATVSNGVVKAKETGTAKITAKAKDGSGKDVSCTVTVTDGTLAITGNATKIGIGETVTLSAKKSGVIQSGVTWSIHTGEDVLEVRNDHNNGEAKYVAKKLGTAIIKATKGSETAYYTVTVATDTYTQSDYEEIYNYTGGGYTYNRGSWASFSKLNSNYTIAIGNNKLNAVIKTIVKNGIFQERGGNCFKIAKYEIGLLIGTKAESDASYWAAKLCSTSHKDKKTDLPIDEYLKQIKSWIDQGKPVLIHVTSKADTSSGKSEHWVTVVGYKTSGIKNVSDLLILGPTFGTLQTIDGKFNESEYGIRSDYDMRIYN